MCKKSTLLIILILYLISPTFSQQKAAGTIGFYNLENLFDTVDDPAINDEEYLPKGGNSWDDKKYQSKITNMSKVIADMAYGVDILGVSEVENRKVLEDLVTSSKLKIKNYQIIHFDSPDLRGVDVALIYRKSAFTPFVIKKISFKDPEDSNFKTRDILWVKGLYLGDTLHVAVNHWPSRRGGKESKRLLAAQILRNAVDSVTLINPNAKIVLMGDFNDDPSNKSIKKILKATSKNKMEDSSQLYNASGKTFKNGYGTLYYKGAWNLFDQIIISQSLMIDNSTNYFYTPNSFNIFAADYMRDKKSENKNAPLRTHSRGAYKNGFSDHYPVFIIIEKK